MYGEAVGKLQDEVAEAKGGARNKREFDICGSPHTMSSQCSNRWLRGGR